MSSSKKTPTSSTKRKSRPASASGAGERTIFGAISGGRPTKSRPSSARSTRSQQQHNLHQTQCSFSEVREGACLNESAVSDDSSTHEKRSILKYMIHEVRALRLKLDPNAEPFEGLPNSVYTMLKQFTIFQYLYSLYINVYISKYIYIYIISWLIFI